MRGAALADIGPLYAAANPNDSHHARSLKEQERLEAEDLETAVSYATLQEAYILVLRKLRIAQAHSFLEDLIQSTILITPMEGDYARAAGRVLRYPYQAISLVDAVNAEIADGLGLPVWTHGHYFDVVGSRVWRV
ncbi:MAG: hypothetical protein M3122_09655 [Actinomycetota bacterium]|nr:hypothetical protein [Actinomycetota bacterium]